MSLFSRPSSQVDQSARHVEEVSVYNLKVWMDGVDLNKDVRYLIHLLGKRPNGEDFEKSVILMDVEDSSIKACCVQPTGMSAANTYADPEGDYSVADVFKEHE